MLVLTNVGCALVIPSTPLPTRVIESSTPSPSPTSTKLASPTPVQPSGAITLTIWTTEDFAPSASASGVIWRDQIAVFRTANLNIALDIVLKKTDGKGGMLDSLMTTRAVAPALIPDIAIVNASDLALVADAKVLQPLDGIVPNELKDDLFPFAKQFSTSQNQLIAIPFAADVQHLIYNQAAISPVPRTWDDLARQKSSMLLPLGGDDAFLLQYLSFGVSLKDFDAIAATQVFTFLRRAREAGYVSDSSLTMSNADDAWSAFASGQAAMAQVTATRYLSGHDRLPFGLNPAFAPVPTRDGKNTTLGSAWAFVVFANDPARKNAAALLIQWLMKAEQLTPFLRAAHRPPAYRGMIVATIDSKEYAAFLRDLMERAIPMPSIAQYAKKADAWRAGNAGVWRGQMTPEQAARNVAAAN